MTHEAPGGAVTGWPHDGVSAVELWDVVVEGATLFARRNEPAFYASLASAVLALRSGEAVRADGAPLPARAWDSVALVGGAVDESRARDAFDAAGIPLDVVSGDPFFAASHGREALGEQSTGYERAVVVDVGQTALKAAGPAGMIHRLRATAVAHGSSASEVCDARLAFVEELAAAVREACRGHVPSLLLLGVPCEIDLRDGRVMLGASTYPIEGDAVPLVRSVLERAGHPATPSAVMNDAVLAAWALARRSPSRARSRLVLTLGFGVGAALIDRAREAS